MKNFFKISINDNRIYGLDILRAIAILFIVFSHGSKLLPSDFNMLHKIFLFDGVSIFFVLSGFLIGGILIKLLDKNKPSKKLIVNFWIRRWFRTFPNYFLILLFLICIGLIFKESFSLWEIKSFFIFSQNLFYPHPDFFLEAWSLSVEEWFYLITPVCIFLLIYFFNIESKQAVILIAISFLVFIFLFRFYKYVTTEINSIEEWDQLFRKQVVTRLDSLMFGVIGAYINYYIKEIWLKYKKIYLFTGILIFIVVKILYLLEIISYNGFYNCVVSFSITSLATLLLIPYLSDLKFGKGIVYNGFSMISLISYSMYLLNLQILRFILRIPLESFMENNFVIVLLKYSVYWLLTILCSIILYKYYEIPTTRLRDSKTVKKIINNFTVF